MTAVAYLARDKGWGPRIKVTVADTPEADAAAAAFFKRATSYEIGQENYHTHDVDTELTTDLGPAMSAEFFPMCEHQMSLALCMGPDHYPSRQQEMERGW